MEIPVDLHENLKCSACKEFLSRSPVYLQHDGNAVCKKCITVASTAIRNTQYESVASLLLFPCKNHDFGCTETVPFTKEDQTILHEEICDYRQYECPILAASKCEWIGIRKKLLEHCQQEHPDNVIDNPVTLKHDFTKDSTSSFLVRAFDLLFALYTKVFVTPGKICYAVKSLGCSNENYYFLLNINRGRDKLSKEGQVAPQGCLVEQEPILLSLNISSLFDVLNGSTDMSFTMMLVQRIKEMSQQSEIPQNQSSIFKILNMKNSNEINNPMNIISDGICKKCSAFVSKLYLNENIWCCEYCASIKQHCKYQEQGCNFEDVPSKCEKHETYFCLKSLNAKHKIFRMPKSISQLILVKSWGRFYLSDLSLLIGNIICSYSMNGSGLVFNVHAQMSTAQLSQFRCIIKVTQVSTGHFMTYMPDVTYNEWWDWRIQVTRLHFPMWKCKYLVNVQIIPQEKT